VIAYREGERGRKKEKKRKYLDVDTYDPSPIARREGKKQKKKKGKKKREEHRKESTADVVDEIFLVYDNRRTTKRRGEKRRERGRVEGKTRKEPSTSTPPSLTPQS